VDQKILDLLRDRGIGFRQLRDILNPSVNIENIQEYSLGEMRRILIVSDTHLGDRQCKLKELKQTYHIAREEGCEIALHAGDWIAGIGIYKGQHNDLSHHTIEDQLKLLEDEYPRDLETIGITGNHDTDGAVQLAGMNIGREIMERRQDISIVGDYLGKVKLGDVRVHLQHGDGGGAYAKSYRLQKYIEALPSHKKPHIYALGHYHTAVFSQIRDIMGLTAGCFQGDNNFSRRKALEAAIGGWIVEYTSKTHRKKGTKLTSFVPKFVSFAKPNEDAA
jgi:predicted phosphodiesterase